MSTQESRQVVLAIVPEEGAPRSYRHALAMIMASTGPAYNYDFAQMPSAAVAFVESQEQGLYEQGAMTIIFADEAKMRKALEGYRSFSGNGEAPAEERDPGLFVTVGTSAFAQEVVRFVAANRDGDDAPWGENFLRHLSDAIPGTVFWYDTQAPGEIRSDALSELLATFAGGGELRTGTTV